MRTGVGASRLVMLGLWGGMAACGGSNFASHDDDSGPPVEDAGMDAKLAREAAVNPPDAGRDAHDAARDAHDAAKDAHDAGAEAAREATAPDVVEVDVIASDVIAPIEATTDAKLDAKLDGPFDAHVDTGVDAGPPCATKSVKNMGSVAVFVQSGTGGPSNGCTLENSCGSIADALTQLDIAKGKNTVFIGPGAYTLSSTLALPDGVKLVGGWSIDMNGNWTGSCDAADTPTFSLAAEEVVTVGSAGTPSTGTVEIDTVNFVNTTTNPATSSSVYGIFAVGSSSSLLLLNDVAITVPAAGDGANGSTGGNGAKGTGGCEQTFGGNGAPGDNGSAAARGTYDDTGFIPAAANASQAGTGAGGATPAPVPGPCNTVTAECGYVLSQHKCELSGSTTVCAQSTESGCGGSGGKGGLSGGGGGSSIALFLWGENASIDVATLISGNGGSGGGGGSGGPGGAGSSGGKLGDPGSYLATCTSAGGDTCNHTYDEIDALPGKPGGTGGVGGIGGAGAGGDSYAIYIGPTSDPPTVQQTSVTTTPGNAGAAGSPGAGLAGYSGATNTAD